MRTGQGFRTGFHGMGLFGGLLVACWLTVAATPQAAAKPTDLSKVNVEPTKPEMIPAGTVIGEKAPEGWTNLIYISTPVINDKDLKHVPKNAAFYAQLLRYAILVKVGKKDNSFDLEKLAVGFAADVKGKEMIVNSRNTFNANLGAFGKRLLTESEKALEKDVQQTAATETMRIIDDRQFVRYDGEHQKMVIRHAILVDPQTGHVSPLIWLLSDKGGKTALTDKEMQLLPPGLHEKYRVTVKPNAFGFLGVPDEDAFARMQIPQGKAVPFTPALEKLAGLKEFSKEQAVDLEQALREAIQKAGKQ